jgi:hypothetical protein
MMRTLQVVCWRLEKMIALSLLLATCSHVWSREGTAQVSTSWIPKQDRRRQTRPAAVRGREASKRSGLSEKLPRFG